MALSDAERAAVEWYEKAYWPNRHGQRQSKILRDGLLRREKLLDAWRDKSYSDGFRAGWNAALADDTPSDIDVSEALLQDVTARGQDAMRAIQQASEPQEKTID